MNSVVPLYFQIKQTIKGWIINKEFTPREKIPSESDLVKMFGVSRLTIRQALSHLIQEGLLITKRGEGTFVTDCPELTNRFSLELSGVMDDLFFQQMSRVKVIKASIAVVKPTRLIQEKLQLGPNEKEVVQLKRVRCQAEQPFTFVINYLPMEIGSKITEEALYQKPLFKILEEGFNIHYTEAIQTIAASFANSEVSENLKIQNGSPILFVERVTYGQEKKPIGFFQLSYRGDMYHFTVRFKYVKSNRGNMPITR